MQKVDAYIRMVNIGERKMVAVRPTKYVNLLFRMTSYPLLHGLYPNVKEWTESCGMFNALCKLFDGVKNLNNLDPLPVVFVIGDGARPRTGAHVAVRSRCKVISIDPALKKKSNKDWGIERLEIVPYKFEETDLDQYTADTLVVLLPHSHYHPERFPEFPNVRNLAVASMPCCVPTIEFMPKYPDFAYVDYNIWSDKNTVEFFVLRDKDKVFSGIEKAKV